MRKDAFESLGASASCREPFCDPKQALLAALAPTNLAQRDLKCAGPIFWVIAAAKSFDSGEIIGDRVAIGTS
jgi:hypothetical protein